ncbi:hypothetical protein G7Y89_g15612 [Cudoniella acicularis]|uniref:Uncharacterized protein n=1 Tax=Cudoniella acicularis TaxID=354080 RepID=A0A8H4QKG0_9HELO|nr:hypothetical protein G7Y89_g15612 [Cudoniella acicularis]
MLEELEGLATRNTHGQRRTNAYFEIIREESEGSQRLEGRLKLAIKEFINRLRSKSSAFLAEFLDLIQDSMLIAEPGIGEERKRRISCGRLYRELGEMIERCELKEGSKYALGPLSSTTDQT